MNSTNFFEFSNSLNKWGEPWELFRVWTPGNQPYTNSLILNEKIFVPITGGSWDDEALAVYETAFPGYEVLGFSGSWESTDALHCRTKGIPDLQMLQIIHNPLNDGSEPDINGYSLDALFDDLSGTGLIEDSMKVFWKTPGAETWDSHTLSRSSAPEEQNVWTGSIPAIVDSGLIQYFVQGADSSGRIEKSPLAGWHTFFAHPTEACDEWLIGDLDNSGELNIIDILMLSEIVNDNGLGICPQSISDINNDDETTVVDIVFLVNIILNP